MKHLRNLVCILAISILSAPAATTVIASPQTWHRFVDSIHGTSTIYPPHLFKPLPPEESTPGQAFLSVDGRARLAIGAWDNDAGDNPGTFRDRLLNDGKHASLTYRPRGRSWFVLSGYRGDTIYYEKVIYSCNRQVVNAFAITYPVAQRVLYDRIVERMEDGFRAGRRCN